MKPEDYKNLPDRDKQYIKPTTIFRKEVLYDINSIPYLDDNNFKAMMDIVIDIYNKSGILIYDFSKGKEPVFTEKELKR